MNWSDLRDAIGNDTSEALTRLGIIALILLVTWVVRWIVLTMIPRFVSKITRRTRTTIDERLVTIIEPPLRFLITTLGVWLALRVLNFPYGISDVINRIMSSLVAIAFFWAAYRGVELGVSLFQRVLRRTSTPVSNIANSRLSLAMEQLARATVILFAATSVLQTWGYNVGSLIAGLGIGGLAVALAAQDALANLIGYFVILADEPFVVGEFIVMGDLSGTVEKLGFRSTRVRMLDQSLVTVPNKTIVNSNIRNWSRLSKRRLNMTLGIEYGNQPDVVLSTVQAIREMLVTHDLVEPDSVVVQFTDFGASSLDLMIIAFMKTPGWNEFQAARQDINLKIMALLDDRGVGIAFPTHTVMLESAAKSKDGHGTAYFPPPKAEPVGRTASDSPVPDDAAN
ncbi:MAG TPA: mechanosensitive ion channel family protein [Aggregatilinea sp.]|uniref:mechanosensitive ion channel family protein n=1 Tax=Aggregatilinea sp. TaxID=2806333 RepID=UPI002B763A7E|nr:mechanosensitive ion channel family protein [Aggregatilinea sp.]HML24492.1 mechanosensitive ion channel family protein [Aggregatilinea sp.]